VEISAAIYDVKSKSVKGGFNKYAKPSFIDKDILIKSKLPPEEVIAGLSLNDLLDQFHIFLNENVFSYIETDWN
jgi:hypothetical protein